MEFGLSEEHELIRGSIREFMAGECPRDRARELDEASEFPEELLQQLGQLGFCGLCVPEEYGGAGRSLLGAAIVVEETAALSPALAGGFISVALRGGAVLAELGSDAQKERLLPPVAGGALLFTHAVDAEGVDAARAEAHSTVEESRDDFLLSGSAAHVSLGTRADYLLALARVDPGSDEETRSSLFVIPADAPGVRRASAATVGYRGTGLDRVRFEGVRLGGDDLLGGPEQLHQGAKQARYLQAVDRLGTAAAGVGIAQGAFDYAAEYARQRVQFGRPIAEFEAIQQKFAEVAGAIRADRLLVYEACWRADQGWSFEIEAAMAAARATALARRASLEAVQILGGQGYMLESDVQRSLRDSLVLFTGAERDAHLQCTVAALLGIGGPPAWIPKAPGTPDRS